MHVTNGNVLRGIFKMNITAVLLKPFTLFHYFIFVINHYFY